MKIEIENKPFSSIEFYSGNYNGHTFTVTVNNSFDNQWVHVAEITWVDETPEEAEAVEHYIVDNFFKEIGQEI